jgi:hypothetical protein
MNEPRSDGAGKESTRGPGEGCVNLDDRKSIP